ncbi:DUF3160 domain-containing protein [Desulfoscipio gibsoniae]|uniref:DUF3160 domain-containing protein n=1 Tax=Desulfoscipio gibsoniae DSM 7213 TaxID=767817 RepID=R4KPF6_9FIRM|nr:DUF3160 domain-containing protein [Desulfoscipio gibsoniae]AGL03447.1 Protein of unknown function (DUF3160) [Desulfoscipio gibsoniae DSM 7213]
MQRIGIISAWVLSMLLLITTVSGCSGDSGQVEQHPAAGEIGTPVALASSFAVYKDVPVDFSPTLEPYKVDPELDNVTNKEMFQLSPEAKQLLVENGFVVVPNQYNREFFMLYETNLYEPVPSFITTDSMLHNYHLFFSHLLRVIEKGKLAPELKELTAAMLTASQKQYAALKGSDWENAARRNIGFFAVAEKLLDPQMPVPYQVEQVVEEELRLIENASGIQNSPLMNMGQDLKGTDTLQEDYSQYIPRGHYTTDEMLQSYFKAMMWYGRMTFRIKSEDETKSAVLITSALGESDFEQKWDKIYQPTSFFVGKADDLSYPQYRELLDKTYGTGIRLKDLASGSDQWTAFMEAAAELEPPVINSIPIFDEELQPDREGAIKGFRFMGQRFTLDAAVFQRLVYRNVKENSQGERRMLPKGLDIPAAMGSGEAYSILEAEGETDYAGYPANMNKLQQYIAGLDKEIWTQNLYWGWLYTLEPLLQERGKGYPSFMQSQAWTRKDLNSFLASWTELKHDTILYAKQIYAEMGGGMAGVDDRGYVEPNPHLYARLAALVNMTREGLASRDLLDQTDRDSLDRLEQLALSLKTISEKELSDIPLTDEEFELIRSYGGQLEHFWLEALSDIGVDHRSAIDENPAALVADVATDPGGRVLQEATGHIFEIYAVVPVDGSLRIARGGVYSHYEFSWPLSDRLTDKKWHELLDSGQAPPLAGWTKTFIAQ